MVMQIRRNFQITLPVAIRVPKKTVDAEQAWFWTKKWQEAEGEAEDDLKSGKVKKFKNVEELIEDLDK